MFAVLLNEDQTPGFLAKALPPPSSNWSRGAVKIEGPVLPWERRISPPLLFPSIHFPPPTLLPLPPLLSLISLSGTQSVSASGTKFISSLRTPQPWSGLWSLFISTLGKWEVCLGRRRAQQRTGNSPKGVQLCLDCTKTLNSVYTNLWHGKGSDVKQVVDSDEPLT